MSNKLKLELMEYWLLDVAKEVLPDHYPDYKIPDIEDEQAVIDCFDTLDQISNKIDMDGYGMLAFDMWYYFWVTTKKWISDSGKKSILDYLEMIRQVYEENQYWIEDYDNDEDMTSEEKYKYDVNQRNEDYNKIVNLINKL